MTGNTVWLASYPKSGNTWFRTVLAAWRHDDPFAFEPDEPIYSNRLRLDNALGVCTTDLTTAEIVGLRGRIDEHYDTSTTAPHLCKIHDRLNADQLSSAATRCAIYLVRDPRDVAVSFAHHLDRDLAATVQLMGNPDGALASRNDDVDAQVRQPLGTWSEHVRSWVDDAPFPVHVVRYEDCLRDPVGTFGAAFAFAGWTPTDDELRAAVAAAAFERLQERERAGGFRERVGRGSPFFRSGRSGGWAEALTRDQAATLERGHGEVMRRFGYLDDDGEYGAAETISERSHP